MLLIIFSLDFATKNDYMICSNEFNKRIKIQVSSILPNNSPNLVAGVSFTTIANAWAKIKTNAAREFIDGVNVENGVNVDFYIIYNSSIPLDKQLWIEYDGDIYRVSNVDNINKDNEIIKLRTIEKGSKKIEANKR
jgi:SPP1 family predicted phage head-tail adaptor